MPGQARWAGGKAGGWVVRRESSRRASGERVSSQSRQQESLAKRADKSGASEQSCTRYSARCPRGPCVFACSLLFLCALPRRGEAYRAIRAAAARGRHDASRRQTARRPLRHWEGSEGRVRRARRCGRVPRGCQRQSSPEPPRGRPSSLPSRRRRVARTALPTGPRSDRAPPCRQPHPWQSTRQPSRPRALAPVGDSRWRRRRGACTCLQTQCPRRP